MEICFISTTKTDEGMGLKGTLCRGELMDLLIRLAQQVLWKKGEDTLDVHLQDLIMKYIMP